MYNTKNVQLRFYQRTEKVVWNIGTQLMLKAEEINRCHN